MTWNELIERVSIRADKTVSEAVLHRAMAWIVHDVQQGGRTTLPGFGTFSLGKRKARVTHNVYDGKRVRLPASTRLRFKASKHTTWKAAP